MGAPDAKQPSPADDESSPPVAEEEQPPPEDGADRADDEPAEEVEEADDEPAEEVEEADDEPAEEDEPADDEPVEDEPVEDDAADEVEPVAEEESEAEGDEADKPDEESEGEPADEESEAEPDADADAADAEPGSEPEEEPEREDDTAGEPEPEPEPAPVERLPPDPSDAARRRLRRALVPRATRSQLLAALVCALLGFAVVVQARQTQVASLASLRESELVAVLDNVSQESTRLDAQTQALQRTLDELRTSSDRAPAAREAAQQRLEVLGVLAGTLPATGPGIEFEIPDPQKAVPATRVLEAVQELRDAGAEVMQFGPVRVVASTSFVDDEAGLLVDGTRVSPPYRLVAIGNPQNLSGALQIPGGVVDGLRKDGTTPTIRSADSLTVSALRTPRTPQYARPARSGS